MVKLLVFCWVVCAGCWASAGTVVIKNANVITMEQDRILKNQSIIIVDERISAMGSSSKIAIPVGAKVIEAKGKYVMPGLVDMHNHLNTPDELTLNLANGVTTLRVMWGNPDVLLWKKQVLSGELSGPTIYSAGPILDGNPPMQPGSVMLTDPLLAVEEIRNEAALGYDFVKVYNGVANGGEYNGFSKEVYEAIVKTAREFGLPVVGHVPVKVGIEGVWASGQRTIEHWQGLLEFLRRDERSIDRSKIPSFIQKNIAAGAWTCPTMTVIDRGFVASAVDMERWMQNPEIRFVHPVIRDIWAKHLEMVKNTPDWADKVKSSVLLGELGPGLVRDMHAAGARLLIGTDTPNPFVYPGFAVHEELLAFQNAGLTPYAVLKIATRDAAEALGHLDSMGSVSVGKNANLLILDRDPRADVRNVKSSLVGAMVLGRWTDSVELQARLEQIAGKYERDGASNLKPEVRAAFGGVHRH